MEKVKGFFIPVFHAYIPYGLERSLEEKYLFEYLADSLYPLLRVFEGLENEGIDYGFTLSLSPILAGMLENPVLMLRFADYIEWRLAVAHRLVAEDKNKSELAQHYINKFKDLAYWHVSRYRYRPLKAIFNLAALGNLEVIFSNAGNGILPVLDGVQGAARAEVRSAVSEFALFSEGAALKGLWLTELAYSESNDKILAEEGIDYFFVDESGFKFAPVPIVNGSAKPVMLKAGVIAFSLNKKAGAKIGLEPLAYCFDGHYAQRGSEQLTELGRELMPDRLAATGAFNNYPGITTQSRSGDLYSSSAAAAIADKHAAHYLSLLCEEINKANVEDGIVVVGIDHEEVGTAWEELPVFIDMLLRKMRYDQDTIRSSTAGKFLKSERQLQVAQVGDSSSAGEGVFSEFYKNEREKYLPELHIAAAKLESATFDNKRVADQMARELLLAQGCEWRYYSRKGVDEEYSRQRQKKRLARFAACEEMLGSTGADLYILSAIEEQCSVLSTAGAASFSN